MKSQLADLRPLRSDPLAFLGDTGSFWAFSFGVFANFISSALGFWLIRWAATS